ncbi:hypothetical protein [Aquihabitans sp. McL0605]|uniref:hypothetical protein n=1 Tax=Aquihabitans sp. McL0605 TaxID=3415671 RepID=UPI003CF2C4D2
MITAERRAVLALLTALGALAAAASGASEYARVGVPGVGLVRRSLVGATGNGLLGSLFLVGAIAIVVTDRSGTTRPSTTRLATAVVVAVTGTVFAIAHLDLAVELAASTGMFEQAGADSSYRATRAAVTLQAVAIAAVCAGVVIAAIRLLITRREGVRS